MLSPVIAILTDSHRTSVFETLLARGVDAAAAIEQGLYLPLDVDEALSTFMVNDLADSVRYPKFLGELVSSSARAANTKHARVAVFGEMAPTLWAGGNADAAIQVEQATEELAKTRNVDCHLEMKNGESTPKSSVCRSHLRLSVWLLTDDLCTRSGTRRRSQGRRVRAAFFLLMKRPAI